MANMQIKERQKEIALKTAAGVVLGLILIWVMVLPAIKEGKRLNQELRATQQRSKLHENMNQLKSNLTTLEAPLSLSIANAALLGKISNIAVQDQINVQTLSPQLIEAGKYLKMKIEMQGEAAYFSLIKFLRSIESMTPPMDVKDVTVLRQKAKKDSPKRNMLRIQLVLETWLLKTKSR